MFILREMKDAAVSSESKMDANKKREITFEDDSDSKFVYKASFISLNLKFCYQWCVACLANFSRGVTAKKV